MSEGRNIYEDRQATNAVLAQGPEAPMAQARPNWLGHRDGSAAIDSALIEGAATAEIEALRGTLKTVKNHTGDQSRRQGVCVANLICAKYPPAQDCAGINRFTQTSFTFDPPQLLQQRGDHRSSLCRTDRHSRRRNFHR